MSAFEDVKVEWAGETFVIPATRVMEAIRRVEAHVTMKELHEMVAGSAPRLAALSAGYGALLRFAGARVDDEAVYSGMFGADPRKGASLVMEAVGGLLGLMIPPEHLRAGQPEGKSPPAAAKSSRGHTGRRSASSG